MFFYFIRRKIIKKYLVMVMVFFICCVGENSFAQTAKVVSTSGKIYAQILDVGNVTKTQDMSFGTIISQEYAQTAKLDCDGNLTGVQTTHEGAISSAHFSIVSDSVMQYQLAVSATDLKDENGAGSNTMSLSNFTIKVDDNDYVDPATLTDGVDDVKVGADLTIKANQPSGDYKGSLTLTVIYQ